MLEARAAEILVLAAAAGSLATLYVLFLRRTQGRSLLAFQPRRPVPWNFVAPLLVLCLPLYGLVAGFTGGPSNRDATKMLPALVVIGTNPPAVTSPMCVPPAVSLACGLAIPQQAERTERFIANVWGSAATYLIFTLIIHLGLAAFGGANETDLGWPNSYGQLLEDVYIGAAACLAALLPVHLIQLLLTTLLEPEQVHPLIEMSLQNPSLEMAAATGVSAVIAAPLFEETSFRLLLQGWLEKVEEYRQRLVAAQGRRFTADAPNNDEPNNLETQFAQIHQQPSDPLGESPTVAAAEPAKHSRWPMLVSGVLFGLAHLGQGVAPVALVLLGIVLGYVYYRTHRIVPCIVCHMLFNSFTLVLLWLQVSSGLNS